MLTSKNSIMIDSVSLPAIIPVRVYDIFLFRRSHPVKHSLFLRSFFLICTKCPTIMQKGLFYIILYDNVHSVSRISLLLCNTFLYLQGLDSNLKIFLAFYISETSYWLNFLNFQINHKVNLYQVYFQASVRRINTDYLQDFYEYFTFFFWWI